MAISPQTLISAHDISLTRRGKIVLDKVSFELQQGEFLTIIGPNGAGKSSLIKVLLGLIKADSGNIKRAKKLKLGYMPQAFSPNPFMPLKVLDFCNLNQSVASSFLQETAELTGIKNLLNSPLKTLSGGELQRVLLTRALLNKPNILILDEPAQNLDVNGQMQLYKLIQNIHQQQGCAVLMISHDLHRVMKESTQVLCLYRHICCMGKPEALIKDAQFNHLYADQMDELMTTYEHHHNHCHEN
ncbi:Zinc ABC transporter, ATP-binding protein ZnuC [uncultured Gammaproteobacteria bacterium]|jgi:zinc transport system ATP-binding protein|nr:Zinc ABC transporter, ATP-binding protein ZnuC [uncultured Gammaproteobacteria bacterium]VVH67351.1 Zinc ABC transporter, ATP-binding protein ZnuC [uncultured Gammaproteobacteria bacterium]